MVNFSINLILDIGFDSKHETTNSGVTTEFRGTDDILDFEHGQSASLVSTNYSVKASNCCFARDNK